MTTENAQYKKGFNYPNDIMLLFLSHYTIHSYGKKNIGTFTRNSIMYILWSQYKINFSIFHKDVE